MKLGAKKYSSLEKIKGAFNKWLLIRDPYLLEVVLGTVAAHLLCEDPLWLFIVAPPSSAKTEILNSLRDLEDCIYPLSDLTPQTLISGYQGTRRDPSLLPKLNEKIITMKDFTTVLTKHRDARGEILSQLREVYDGSYVKSFGTGEEKHWEGRVGFIAGVTEIIDSQTAVHSILGERFILYRHQAVEEDRKRIARRAMENAGTENIMREELREAVEGFIEDLGPLEGVQIYMPEPVIDTIAALADLTAKGRAAVPRDGYSRQICYIPQPETPARLAKQFALLAKGIAVVRGRRTVTEKELEVIRKVARDTMIRQRVLVLNALSRDWTETKPIAQAICHPTRTTLERLEDCYILNLVERDMEEDEGEVYSRNVNTPYRWRLAEGIAKDIEESGIFPGARYEEPLDEDPFGRNYR